MTNQLDHLKESAETAAPSSEEMQRIAGYRKNDQWSDLQKHLTYQLQETVEQVVAFNQRDEEAFRDASGDIRVLLDAQKASVTYSLDDDYEEIVTKLFTRLDDTIEGAEKTQQKYAALGVTTYIVHDERTGQYINRVSETVTGTDGETYPKDKWLKSYKFQTPTFELVGLKDDREDKPTINKVTNAGVVLFIGTPEEHIEHARTLCDQFTSFISLPPLGMSADLLKIMQAAGNIAQQLNSVNERKAIHVQLDDDDEVAAMVVNAIEKHNERTTLHIKLEEGDDAEAEIMKAIEKHKAWLNQCPPSSTPSDQLQSDRRFSDAKLIDADRNLWQVIFTLKPKENTTFSVLGELGKHGLELTCNSYLDQWGYHATSARPKVEVDVVELDLIHNPGVSAEINEQTGVISMVNNRDYNVNITANFVIGEMKPMVTPLEQATEAVGKLLSMGTKDRAVTPMISEAGPDAPDFYIADLVLHAGETLTLPLLTLLAEKGFLIDLTASVDVCSPYVLDLKEGFTSEEFFHDTLDKQTGTLVIQSKVEEDIAIRISFSVVNPNRKEK